jgi:hypothetical protein
VLQNNSDSDSSVIERICDIRRHLVLTAKVRPPCEQVEGLSSRRWSEWRRLILPCRNFHRALSRLKIAESVRYSAAALYVYCRLPRPVRWFFVQEICGGATVGRSDTGVAKPMADPKDVDPGSKQMYRGAHALRAHLCDFEHGRYLHRYEAFDPNQITGRPSKSGEQTSSSHAGRSGGVGGAPNSAAISDAREIVRASIFRSRPTNDAARSGGKCAGSSARISSSILLRSS